MTSRCAEKRSRYFMLGAALLVACVSAEHPSFGCEKVWSNASSKNDVMKCMTTASNYSSAAGMFVPAALCVLFLVCLGLFYPFFFCCRQCCNLCGGRHRQPGYCCTGKPEEWADRTQAEKDAAYTAGQRWCAKIGLLIVFLVGGGAIIVMNTGAAKGVDSVHNTLDDFEIKLLGNISGLETNIKNLLKDILSPTGYAGNMSNTTFDPLDKAVSGLRNSTNSIRSNFDKYSGQVQLGASLLSAAPLIFMLPLVLFALFGVRRFGPACCTCCYWFTALLFCLLGLIFLIFAVVFTDLCGEVDRYKAGEPGILKWYAEPMCADQITNLNVTQLTSTFTDKMKIFSGEVCKNLAQVCDSTVAYNAATPKLVFQCALTPATAAASCTTFAQANAIIQGSTPKTGFKACGGGTVACNMTGCSVSCDAPQAKSGMSDAISLLGTALKFEKAFDLVTPLLTCSYWFAVVLQVFDHCHDLRDSWWMMGASFLVGVFTFTAGICLAFRGQKVFFSPPEEVREDGLSEIRRKDTHEVNDGYEMGPYGTDNRNAKASIAEVPAALQNPLEYQAEEIEPTVGKPLENQQGPPEGAQSSETKPPADVDDQANGYES